MMHTLLTTSIYYKTTYREIELVWTIWQGEKISTIYGVLPKYGFFLMTWIILSILKNQRIFIKKKKNFIKK